MAFLRNTTYKNKRIWAIDRDNRIGWHIHPLENPNSHIETTENTINEIVNAFDMIYEKIQNEK